LFLLASRNCRLAAPILSVAKGEIGLLSERVAPVPPGTQIIDFAFRVKGLQLMLQGESDVSPFFLTFARNTGSPGKMEAVGKPAVPKGSLADRPESPVLGRLTKPVR
jgi:hypothetical protein